MPGHPTRLPIRRLRPIEGQAAFVLLQAVLALAEQPQGLLLPFDGGIEVTRLGLCGGESVESELVLPVGDLTGAACRLDGSLAVAVLGVRARGPDPGDVLVRRE